MNADSCWQMEAQFNTYSHLKSLLLIASHNYAMTWNGFVHKQQQCGSTGDKVLKKTEESNVQALVMTITDGAIDRYTFTDYQFDQD